MSLFGTLAWLGSAALGICGAPLAVSAWRQGHAEGVDTWMVLLWLAGEALLLPYLFLEAGMGPAVADATMNLVFASVVAYYKWRPDAAGLRPVEAASASVEQG